MYYLLLLVQVLVVVFEAFITCLGVNILRCVAKSEGGKANIPECPLTSVVLEIFPF